MYWVERYWQNESVMQVSLKAWEKELKIRFTNVGIKDNLLIMMYKIVTARVRGTLRQHMINTKGKNVVRTLEKVKEKHCNNYRDYISKITC